MNRSAVIEMHAFYALQGKKAKRVTVEGRNFYSLSFRYHGKVLLKADGSEYISAANSITFMPKGTSYETEIMEDSKMAVIHFKLSEDIKLSNPAVLEIHDREIQRIFEKLIQSYRVDTPIDFLSMSLLYELLARLEAIAPLGADSYIPKKIALAKEKMLMSFSDPCLSVSSIAEEFGISTSYLRREFSKAYGKSPISFLRDLRISNAKNLLQSEYLSVARIAEACGFTGESYFIQVFHKAVGLSPDRYRRQNYIDR